MNKRELRSSLLLDPSFPGRAQYWQIVGMFYGYPPCCIDSFCKLNHLLAPPGGVQEQIGNGTGFIPCMPCARRVAAGEISLGELIDPHLRVAKGKFPKDTNTEVDEWLRSMP